MKSDSHLKFLLESYIDAQTGLYPQDALHFSVMRLKASGYYVEAGRLAQGGMNYAIGALATLREQEAAESMAQAETISRDDRQPVQEHQANDHFKRRMGAARGNLFAFLVLWVGPATFLTVGMWDVMDASLFLWVWGGLFVFVSVVFKITGASRRTV